jgi:hypothetical protein
MTMSTSSDYRASVIVGPTSSRANPPPSIGALQTIAGSLGEVITIKSSNYYLTTIN